MVSIILYEGHKAYRSLEQDKVLPGSRIGATSPEEPEAL